MAVLVTVTVGMWVADECYVLKAVDFLVKFCNFVRFYDLVVEGFAVLS